MKLIWENHLKFAYFETKEWILYWKRMQLDMMKMTGGESWVSEEESEKKLRV